jgi:hypothetical protein
LSTGINRDDSKRQQQDRDESGRHFDTDAEGEVRTNRILLAPRRV